MRDLQKDLEEWIADYDIGALGEWFYLTGEYIERAIKAEAEVERLYKINQGCESEARLYDDLLRRCRVENAQLRKVVDAARALVPSEMYQYTRHLFDLKHTLDEYDKAKEGKER